MLLYSHFCLCDYMLKTECRMFMTDSEGGKKWEQDYNHDYTALEIVIMVFLGISGDQSQQMTLLHKPVFR